MISNKVTTESRTTDVVPTQNGNAGNNGLPTKVIFVKAGATQIVPGQVIVADTVNIGYGIPAVDAQLAGSEVILGVSQGYSTQTSTADGTVEVFRVDGGQTFYMNAKSGALTAATLKTTVNKNYIIDITSGVTTVDNVTAAATGNQIRVLEGVPGSKQVIVKFVNVSAQ